MWVYVGGKEYKMEDAEGWLFGTLSAHRSEH